MSEQQQNDQALDPVAEAGNAASSVTAGKAFDLHDLESRLRERGLPQVEGLARTCAEVIFDWVGDGVRKTDSKLDDLLLAVIPSVRTFVLSKLDGLGR